METLFVENRCDPAVQEALDEIEEHVQSSLAGQVRNFRVVYQEGGLVLLGHCHTYYGKQLAQEAVMKATAYPIRSNSIEVM